MMNKPNSFPKSEHLCGEIRIAKLFTGGKAFIVYPLRIVYLLQPKLDENTASVLVSVPKKRFKRAVKRNRIKRLIRESYRLNKHELRETLDSKNAQIHVAFNYVSDDEPDFELIQRKMNSALNKLVSIVLG